MKRSLSVAIGLGATVLVAGVDSASAQVVSPKTVPVHQESQFEIFPSRRAGMAGVSIALDDTLNDPFVNPAKAMRVPSGWLQIAPFRHELSRQRGGGRTVPLSGFVSNKDWGAAAVFSLQELERPLTQWNTPISEQRATNTYYMGSLARRLGERVAIGASFYASDLGAVDAVDLLYAGSDRIRQSGRQNDARLGITVNGASGSTFEALVLHDRYDMTHDVHFPQQWRWSPCCPNQQPLPIPERTEHNLDRSNTTGAHIEYSRPFGVDGWRFGWLATANRITHPKIPNYQIQQIPRDPGNTDGYNVGFGLARVRQGSTIGIDLVLEPIWSTTWADMTRDTISVNNVPIPAGTRTVENHFRFSNTLLRAGFAQDIPMNKDSSSTFGFQAGLTLYSIKYQLDQSNRITNTARTQDENWIEWTPTVGVSYRGRDIEISYLFSKVCGPNCNDNQRQFFPPPATPDAGGGPVIAAPNAPLDIDGGVVTRHRIMFSFRLK